VRHDHDMPPPQSYKGLLDHLMLGHEQLFMTLPAGHENPAEAWQHLAGLHERLHTGPAGRTDALHFDELTRRWRYHDGRPAESTKHGPIRHRAEYTVEDGGPYSLADELLGEHPIEASDMSVRSLPDRSLPDPLAQRRRRFRFGGPR
jgi:hypothetical protein